MNMFGQTGAPHFFAPPVCQKIVRGQSYLLLNIKKTPKNKLVESMHYCMHKFLKCKH